jgi:prepilin-type processing-associated H-X9-DG protein/prepilin-type N-terminal cleavage/methylation domain-containing protein
MAHLEGDSACQIISLAEEYPMSGTKVHGAVARQRTRVGFTLVELLVVIGIIALLISILLPALNRARAAANLVKCQAQMRQIGQAIQLYANRYDGYLPATMFEYVPSIYDDWWGWQAYHITGMLTGELGMKDVYDKNRTFGRWHVSPVFHDVDVPEPATSWGNPWLYHYNFNLAMFPYRQVNVDWVHNGTPATERKFLIRSIGRVRPAANVVAVWDGSVQTGNGGNAHHHHAGMRDTLGGQPWYAGGRNFDYNGMEQLGGWLDRKMESHANAIRLAYTDSNGHVDFRHVRNTTANLLFLDGHVEARKYGDVYVRDFCFNWK